MPANTNSPLDLLQKPYILMRGVLDTLDRDIVFSLCQYGWGNVWEWGDQVGGNLWRVTGDITDTWPSMSAIGFQQTGHEKYAGPGHWNDTDMLVVGMVGWGRRTRRVRRSSRRTSSSRTSRCGRCRRRRCSSARTCRRSMPWTIDLLGNREVLAINQDAMGKAAAAMIERRVDEVWARPLEDGTIAVGLFNRGPEPAQVSVKLADLSLSGSQPVRDVWSHQDRGTTKDGVFSATVPRHGAVLVKLGRPSSGSRWGSLAATRDNRLAKSHHDVDERRDSMIREAGRREVPLLGCLERG